jgi:hypothetical protein
LAETEGDTEGLTKEDASGTVPGVSEGYGEKEIAGGDGDPETNTPDADAETSVLDGDSAIKVLDAVADGGEGEADAELEAITGTLP